MTHPPIDFSKLPEIDPDRLGRAMTLKVIATKAEAGQYLVVNPLDPTADDHNVDLHASDTPRCDCGDFLYREVLCKHILSCLIYEHNEFAVDALVQYFAKRRKL